MVICGSSRISQLCFKGLCSLLLFTLILNTGTIRAEATLEEAKAFSEGKLLPHRPVDPHNLPNSIHQAEAEIVPIPSAQTIETLHHLQKSSAISYEQEKGVSKSRLANTLDADITPDVKALANTLNNNPVKIYEFFLNNIEYEPYYFGSVKGSQETLYQKSGNPFDIASTFIATLRAAGFQARYVSGNIRINTEPAKRWIGVSDTRLAGNILATAGFSPKIYVDQNGNPVLLQTKHIWTEYYDTTTGAWIAVDPSFKSHTLPSGRDLHREAGNDPIEALEAMNHQGMFDNPNGVMEPDLEVIDEIIEGHEETLEEYLSSQPGDLSYNSIVEPRSIVKSNVTGIPSTLPYTIHGSVTRQDELNDKQRQHLRISINGINQKLALPQIAARRITLDYAPATAADQSTIESYGGLLNTPYKAVKLKPQLRIGGDIIATGKALEVGSYQTLEIQYYEGSTAKDKITHQVTVGGHYAVALDTQKISLDKFDETLERVNALKDQYKNNVLKDEFMGELLHLLGMIYFRQVDNVVENISTSTGSIVFHKVSQALISVDLTARRNSAGQYIMSVGQRGIDAPRNIYAFFSATNDSNYNSAGLLLSVGYAASALEHSVFEKSVGWPSVSSMSFIRFAANHEIPIYTIKPDNISEILPKLEIQNAIKDGIQNAISAGRWVITPQRNLMMGKWSGLGYIVLNPATGAAGFLITGGLAGGKQSFTPMDLPTTNKVFTDDVKNITQSIVNGALYGEFDETIYDDPLYDNLSAGTAFVSDFLLVGDFRNIGITTYDAIANNAGWGPVALSTAALIPLFDIGKGLYKVGKNVFDDEVLKATVDAYKTISPHAENIVSNLSRQAEVTNVSLGKLDGGFDAASITARRNGKVFTNVAIKDGHGFLRNLGLNPNDALTQSQKALIGEKTAVYWGTKNKNWRCIMCDGNPSGNGLDVVFRDNATGDYIITEVKFLTGNSNFGRSKLSTTKDGRQMTDQWIVGPDQRSGAIGRTSNLSDIQKGDLYVAFAANKIKKQIVVVKDRQSGSGITETLTKDAELGANGTSPLNDITIIELPLN